MRYDPIAELEKSEAEISWFFNDINLTMVILVLFFAIIFASMVTESQGTRESSTSEETIPRERPSALSNVEYYGESGLAEPAAAKGFPTKDSFNEELLLIEADDGNEGMDGNLVWDFTELDQIREKKLVRVRVSRTGEVSADGALISLEDLKISINDLAQAHNVFIRLYIDPEAPVRVYERMRNELWNQSDAVHWQFITQET